MLYPSLGFRNGIVDPFFASVVLLLHGDGTNGSTTFTDSSSTPTTVTPSGEAQISTAQSKFGGASMLFDGSGDYLSINDSEMNLGTGDFTVEFWFYPTTINGQIRRVVTNETGGFNTTSFCIRLSALNKIQVFVGTSNASSSSTIVVNTWYHCALVRSGTAVTLYLDGVSNVSFTSSANVSNTTMFVGGYYSVGPSEFFAGYVDDLRITSGVARYTGNFTIPTEAYPDR